MICLQSYNINSISKYTFKAVLIYKNKIISQKKSNNLGQLIFKVCSKGFYKIKIYSQKAYVEYNIYYQNKDIYLPVYYNNEQERYITLKLTDKNYQGLKIEKGKIILWENHIQ